MSNGNAIGNALGGLLVVGLIARVGRRTAAAFKKPIRGYGKLIRKKYPKHKNKKPILRQFGYRR